MNKPKSLSFIEAIIQLIFYAAMLCVAAYFLFVCFGILLTTFKQGIPE